MPHIVDNTVIKLYLPLVNPMFEIFYLPPFLRFKSDNQARSYNYAVDYCNRLSRLIVHLFLVVEQVIYQAEDRLSLSLQSMCWSILVEDTEPCPWSECVWMLESPVWICVWLGECNLHFNHVNSCELWEAEESRIFNVAVVSCVTFKWRDFGSRVGFPRTSGIWGLRVRYDWRNGCLSLC